MNRLSALDALFLYMETSKTPMHVGSLTIFTPEADAREGVFERFRDHTAARLDMLPSYRRRLETTPLGVDHPVWVDDDDIDLDYHLIHLALPAPGSMDQLRGLVARLHTTPLERSRPLWQYYLIEGLEGGRFAVYVKVHHADMDGVAGTRTVDVVYDFTADPPPAYSPSRRIPSGESQPDFLELSSTAIAAFIRQGLRMVRALPGTATALTKIGGNLLRDADYLLAYARSTPRTLFNVSISKERAYGTASLSLTDAKRVAKARHTTINDIVMAVCAGALRRYLNDHQMLPKTPMMAAMPASLREPGDLRLNNQVVFTLCRLATDVPEPLGRLAATRIASQEGKDLFADAKELLTTDVSILGMPIVLSALAQAIGGLRAADFLPMIANVVISNIPGPRTTIYCAGAPAVHYFPLSIPYHGSALNITVQSYLDRLEFGLTACRATVPDVQTIADYLVEEIEALVSAHDALYRPDAVETIEIRAPAVPVHRNAKSRSRIKRPAKDAVDEEPSDAAAKSETSSATESGGIDNRNEGTSSRRASRHNSSRGRSPHESVHGP